MLLWQGSPSSWPLAHRALRMLPIGAYFGLLALWHGWSALQQQHSAREVLQAVGIPLLLGAAVLALLALIGWAAARATLYSITSQRVVIRHGIALPMSLNLPFKHIDSASLRMHHDGTGDVALVLNKAQRVGYLLSWPHVRPGHYAQPQPTPRAAEVLAAALAESARGGECAPPAIVRVAPAKAAQDARAPVAA